MFGFAPVKKFELGGSEKRVGEKKYNKVNERN